MATIAEAASIVIDTDGQFHIKNFDSFGAADTDADIASEAGLPAIAITRAEFIRKATSGEPL